MNITYLVGTVLAIVFMVFGMVSKTVDGAVTFQLNQIVNFFDASSILIVIGCTLAVVVASCPVKLIKAMPKHFRIMLNTKKYDPMYYIQLIDVIRSHVLHRSAGGAGPGGP